jgi:hypothetical protein
MLTVHVTTDLEPMLVDVGAVKQNDPRLQRRPAEREEEYVARSIKTGGGGGKTSTDEDEDSDWD